MNKGHFAISREPALARQLTLSCHAWACMHMHMKMKNYEANVFKAEGSKICLPAIVHSVAGNSVFAKKISHHLCSFKAEMPALFVAA